MGKHHSKDRRIPEQKDEINPHTQSNIPDFNLLPEEVLQQILFLVPAPDLILRCSLVCTRWRDIVNSPILWNLKFRNMGYISKESLRNPRAQKQFYHLYRNKKQNLLKNPCGMDGFQFWNIVTRWANEVWTIEDLQGEYGHDFPHKDVTKCFVTSEWYCKKSQLIDLEKMGYGGELLDLVQPNIVIRDWYAGVKEYKGLYEVYFQLLSGNQTHIRECKPKAMLIESWSEDPKWQQVTFTFRKYGPGVRYVYFEHGQNTRSWGGRSLHGVRVTNSSVTIEPEDLGA